MFRDSTSCASMSAVSIPIPITRANGRTIACGPSLGAFDTFQASILDLPNLITDQTTALHIAAQLSQRVGRYGFALGRGKSSRRSAAAPGGRFEGANGIEGRQVQLRHG
jgi:hypothetical protein